MAPRANQISQRGGECTLEKAVQHLWDWQHGGSNFGALKTSMKYPKDTLL